MYNESNIVIIGSGPAGVSTWLFLQRFAPEIDFPAAT